MAQSAKLGSGVAKIGLIKRDLTKLGCSRDVAVIWRNEPVALWRHDQPTPDGYEPNQRIIKQRVPKCPHCGVTVMQERKGTSVPASENWLKSGKRACSVCQTPLWQEARDRGSRPKKGEKYPTKNARYRLDMYLKRQYADRVFLLVWDEVHECQSSDTGNGESFGRLAGIAQKVLGMTGTPFNGRASSLFNLEYHMNPRVRERFPWGGADCLSKKERGTRQFQTITDASGQQRGRAESQWVAAMGVREMVVEERPTYDSNTGAYTGTSTYERPYQEAPGISPLLVAEVLDHTIFFGLGDLGKQLPEYEEIALPVEMDADTYDQYDRTRALLKDYLIQRRWEGDSTFRGAYLQWSMGWPNAAHRPHDVIHNIKHPITGEKKSHVVTRIPSYGEDRIYAKEQALIDLLTDELANGRPCVVYLPQTATRDIQPRIESLIRQHVPGAVVQAAIELGGVLVEDGENQTRQTPRPAPKVALPERLSSDTARLVRYVGSYLDGVHLIHDRDKRLKLQARLLTILTDGVVDNEETRTVVGLRDPDFGQYPVHEETLIRHVRGWLKQHRFVFTGCEDEAAAKIVDLAKQALGLTPVKLDIFEKLEEMRDEELQRELTVTLKADRPAASTPARQLKRKREKLDLLAVPDDDPETVSDVRPLDPKHRQTEADEHAPQQLAMF